MESGFVQDHEKYNFIDTFGKYICNENALAFEDDQEEAEEEEEVVESNRIEEINGNEYKGTLC